LAEARRLAHKLRLTDETGLATSLQALVERTSVPGRLRCDFRSNDIPEKNLLPGVRHELLRIAQEAIHNAARHANPTLIVVALQWQAPNLVLRVKDNGSGICEPKLEKTEGFGLGSMRARASEINGRFEIQTAAGQGTTIIVTVPIEHNRPGLNSGLLADCENAIWFSCSDRSKKDRRSLPKEVTKPR
jgi:signal transduction histidine kinase